MTPDLASARFTSLTVEPRSRPLMRAVTATMRFRSSRVISGWPLSGTRVATRLSGNKWPSGARNRRLSMLRMVSRTSRGIQTRTPINFGPCWMCVVTLPAKKSLSALVTTSGSMPSRATLTRSTSTLRASPAGTMPFFTSTTPRTLEIVSATRGASARKTASSSEKGLISIGCGTLVRSPIKSSIS